MDRFRAAAKAALDKAAEQSKDLGDKMKEAAEKVKEKTAEAADQFAQEVASPSKEDARAGQPLMKSPIQEQSREQLLESYRK